MAYFHCITGNGGETPEWDDAIIKVIAPPTSTVTITKGSDIRTGTGHTVSGEGAEYLFYVHSADYGTWQIGVTYGTDTATDTVTVSDNLMYERNLCYAITCTCQSDFAGQTITLSQSGHQGSTATCPSASPYTVYFYALATGTWTISGTASGSTYTTSVTTISGTYSYTATLATASAVFTYSGTYAVTEGTYTVVDNIISITSADYTVELLASGTLGLVTMTSNADIHCVGGGGGGVTLTQSSNRGASGGGGGGYTTTSTDVALTEGSSYTITIGAGGAIDNDGNISSFGTLCTANGGAHAVSGTWTSVGGAGGSGGAYCPDNGTANGGTNGGNGGGTSGGAGQGTTTMDFADASGTLRAGGGGSYWTTYSSTLTGTGGAGGGGDGGVAGTTNYGGGAGGISSGGSGVVIFRNHRAS